MWGLMLPSILTVFVVLTFEQIGTFCALLSTLNRAQHNAVSVRGPRRMDDLEGQVALEPVAKCEPSLPDPSFQGPGSMQRRTYF